MPASKKTTKQTSPKPYPETDPDTNAFVVSDLSPVYQRSSFDKMDKIRAGISKKELENLKRQTELDYDKLSHALSVTRATLINKKDKDKYNPAVSERILSLADIYAYGYEVFGDEQRFKVWMQQPNRALGGRSPYDIIDNVYGREEIRNLIGRIAHGVFS